jgi:TAG lipase/lysophosphatidylethanolamine acyltransferase
MARIVGLFGSVWGMLVEVVLFWKRVRKNHRTVMRYTDTRGLAQRFLGWLTRKKPVDFWYECLKNAQTYEEWEEAAFQLDVLLGNDLWSVPTRVSSEHNSTSAVMLTDT